MRRTPLVAPRRRRRAPLALLAASVLSALGLCGCQGSDLLPFNEAAEKQKDKAATAEFYETSALTYYDGGKYEASVQMWEKVLDQQPENQKAKWGLAKSLQMIGTPSSLRRAEAILTPILGNDWTHPELGDRSHEVKGTLAMVYQDLADYYDRDVRALEAQRDRDPSAATAALTEQLQTQVAARNGLLAKSIPLWEAGLAVRDDNPYALAGLGKSHLMLGHDEQGISYARRYIQVARSSQIGWRTKMKEWEKQQGSGVTEDQRMHFARKIQEARGNELKVHLLLASVHTRREEYPLALEEYNAVLEMDPALPAALVERAQVLAKLARYPEAVKDLETYLKLTDPEKQRSARTRAAELLDRYRRMAGMDPLIGRPIVEAARPPGR